jgi:bloom syndrome protein
MLKSRFSQTPFMALTATATEKVKLDVMKQLKMKQGTTALFQSSFDRPNLSWIIMPKDDGKDKKKALEQLLKICKLQYKAPQCGIIYCLSQKDTEEVSQYLSSNKVQASFYHAGNSAKDRAYVQQNWEKGNIRIVVATIAFGMGIDKKNVRFVVHFCAPKSIDGYYQETGRAGRDGNPSDCILLYSPKDIGRLNRLINMPKKGNSRAMKQRGKAKVQEVKEFCENKTICRRKYLINYYGQNDSNIVCGQEGRNNYCDVCRKNCGTRKNKSRQGISNRRQSSSVNNEGAAITSEIIFNLLNDDNNNNEHNNNTDDIIDLS